MRSTTLSRAGRGPSLSQRGASGCRPGTAEASLDVRLGFPFWLRPFVAGGVAAITIGRRVYLDPSVASLPVHRVCAIIHHEAIHVNQSRRHGLATFLVRYVFEYLRNRAAGLSASDAYREISFEKEAFAEERAIERLEKNA